MIDEFILVREMLAAPVVAVGTAVGVLYGIGKKIFGK